MLGKSDGQNKVARKNRPYPLYFGCVLGHKWPLQGRHFPDEFRADLYVFGIRRARRMPLPEVQKTSEVEDPKSDTRQVDCNSSDIRLTVELAKLR